MPTLADLVRGYNREAVAGTLGAPVDMANTLSNMVRAGIGYSGHKLGVLPTENLPQLVDNPVGGSDWIYSQLRGPELTGSTAENVGRAAGAFFSPPVVMQAAPRAARALVGMLREKVPQIVDKAVSATGLQLNVMPKVYHSTAHAFDDYDFSLSGRSSQHPSSQVEGIWFSGHPKTSEIHVANNVSNRYPLDRYGPAGAGVKAIVLSDFMSGANTRTAKLDLKNPLRIKNKEAAQMLFEDATDYRHAGSAFRSFAEQAKQNGHDGIIIAGNPMSKYLELRSNNYLVFDPKAIK